MRRMNSKFRGFETLENRALMAGDFSATYDPATNTLAMTGDVQDNSFTFVGDGAGGFVFTGTNGTTINGLATFNYDAVNFPVDNLIVDFGAGNDSAQIYGAAGSTLQNVSLTGGAGSDVFQFGSFAEFNINPATVTASSPTISITNSLVINGGEGADLVELVSVTGGAAWTINLGDASAAPNNTANTDAITENDLPGIDVDDQIYVYIATAGDATITGGTGDDVINLTYLTAQGTLTATGDAGQDLISVYGSVFNDTVTFTGGNDADLIVVDYSRDDATGGAVIINGDAGGDFIRVARSLFNDDVLTVNGGLDGDLLMIGRYSPANNGVYVTGGNVVMTLNITGSDGSDAVDVRANSLTNLFADLGAGDDDLDLLYNAVSGAISLQGGPGFDSLTAIGNSGFDNNASFGFERRDSSFNPDA